MLRRVTQNLVESMILDIWPRAAAICDFGISSQEHYNVLHRLIRIGKIMPEELDAVLGNGPAITNLVQKHKENPHPGLIFKTPYDE